MGRLVLQPSGDLAREVELVNRRKLLRRCRIEGLQRPRASPCASRGAARTGASPNRAARARGAVRPARAPRARCRTACAMKSSTCGASATSRSDSARPEGGFARAAASFSAQRAVRVAKKTEERAIDLDQAFALVEIGEGDAEAKLHEGRIIAEIFPAFPYSSREFPMQIKNSVFLVTGGASGLGAASARMAAENGARSSSPTCRRSAGEKLAPRSAAASSRPTSPRRPTARPRSPRR